MKAEEAIFSIFENIETKRQCKLMIWKNKPSGLIEAYYLNDIWASIEMTKREFLKQFIKVKDYKQIK